MVGRKPRHPRSIRRILSGALPLLVLASMLVHAPAAQAAGGPTIASDKPDYRAGDVGDKGLCDPPSSRMAPDRSR